MTVQDELDWVAARRPDTAPPSAEATRAARRALRGHLAPAPVRTRPRRRRRVLAATAGLAAAATLAVAALQPAGDVLAPQHATASPLVDLSARLAGAAAPSGDATLVVRRHEFPGDRPFTGADLYLDDGRYFYAPVRAELSRAGEVGDSHVGRYVRAAVRAVADPAGARAQVLRQRPQADPAPAAAPEKRPRTADMPPPASQATLDDNWVWMACMDAITAGAGRSDVRAGVMRLLATIPTVEVTERDGMLEITATDYPDRYRETMFVDARTGILRRFEGGTAGERPDVVVTYVTRRVEAASVLG